MSLSSAIQAFFAKPSTEVAATDKRNEIASSFFGSKRFVLIIALVAFVYLTYSVLNLDLIKVVANVAIVYLICETVSNLALTISNAIIKLHEVKLDIEYSKLPLQGIAQGPVGPLGGATSPVTSATP
jgi:hypothetical protein